MRNESPITLISVFVKKGWGLPSAVEVDTKRENVQLQIVHTASRAESALRWGAYRPWGRKSMTASLKQPNWRPEVGFRSFFIPGLTASFGQGHRTIFAIALQRWKTSLCDKQLYHCQHLTSEKRKATPILIAVSLKPHVRETLVPQALPWPWPDTVLPQPAQSRKQGSNKDLTLGRRKLKTHTRMRALKVNWSIAIF